MSKSVETIAVRSNENTSHYKQAETYTRIIKAINDSGSVFRHAKNISQYEYLIVYECDRVAEDYIHDTVGAVCAGYEWVVLI